MAVETEEFAVEVFIVTELAILIDKENNIWIPKSQVRNIDDVLDDINHGEFPVETTIEIPVWLAEENELV